MFDTLLCLQCHLGLNDKYLHFCLSLQVHCFLYNMLNIDGGGVLSPLTMADNTPCLCNFWPSSGGGAGGVTPLLPD